MPRTIAGPVQRIVIVAGFLAFLAGCAGSPSPAASASVVTPTPAPPTAPPVALAAQGSAYTPTPYGIPNAAAPGGYPNAVAPAYSNAAAPSNSPYGNPYGNAAPPAGDPTATPGAGYAQPTAPGPSNPAYPPPGAGYAAPYPGAQPPNPNYQPPASGYGPINPAGGPAGVSWPAAAASSGGGPRIDRNVVPVGATDVGPAGPDVIPAIGMGPAPAPPPVGPVVTQPAPPTQQAAAASPPTDDKPKDDDDKGWDWTHLAPEQAWKDFKDKIGWGPDHTLARAAFNEGMALYHDKKYDEAAEKFYIASWRWPDSTMEEDALFFMGESYFFADRYAKAYDAYALLFKQHENNRYLDTVVQRLYHVGRYWEELDDKEHHWPATPNMTDKTRPHFDTCGNALAAYEFVRLHDPTGPLADYSIMATAGIHFRRGEWEEAAYHYDLLRKDYPKSRFQKDAHLLGLQAKLRVYQGPRYDVTALNDAKDIADQTLKQFHGQLGDEEARVSAERGHIIEMKAEREWTVAQYYDNKKQYLAARKYYQAAIDKYPHTHIAEQSRARLDEIRNEPDNPPERFKWLTLLFERKD